MKKKVVMMVVTMAMAAAMMTGCGAKGDTASQTTQESQTADASTMSGTLDEVKDFMFVVTDAQGASYAFTFDGEKPAGLDDAKKYLRLIRLKGKFSQWK